MMASFQFYWPYAAVLFLGFLPLWYFSPRDQALLHTHLAQVLGSLSLGKRGGAHSSVRPWFLCLSFALLALGLMRPQWVGEPIETSRSGRSIMITLDTSESMEAQDMNINGKPLDRLSMAKLVLGDFIARRAGDRLGLVIFGAEAFLHAPLSFDRAMITRFLNEAQIGFAGPKTAIGNALGLSVKKLLNQEKGDRVVILLTDGQNNAGQLSPMQAAEIAKNYGVKIYIVGLGASRMVVDGFFGPSAVNPSQDLDEAEPELKKIAAMTGGAYYRARDSEGLMRIYQEIDALEPVKVDTLVTVPRKELFYWPIGMLVTLLFMTRIFYSGFFRRSYGA